MMRRGKAGRVAMLAAWVALTPAAAMARDPDPVLRVPLDPMGYTAPSQGFLVSGSSMLTVDFVDKDHLLITFGVRRLMKRAVDPAPDDDDHVIGAFLVELPSGRVLARTEWRLHDRGQYLWNLGHGRFVLRVRDSLTVFAPVAALDSDDPFRQSPFLHMDRRIVAILVSADEDLLTVETAKPEPERFGGDPAPTDGAPVQVNFFRMNSAADPPDTLLMRSAGVVRTRGAVALPITTSGFLDVREGGKNRWLFNFSSHTGKVSELAPFETTCYPHATFVGRGDFVAFGCRGSEDKQDLVGFNLKGEETWEQIFYDTHIYPTFAFAPAAGRFALSRLITADGSVNPMSLLAPSQVGAQEVRVYQSYDGQQLLRIDCSPVERAGQNFALSPDGLRIAVVRESMVRHPATKDDAAYTDTETAVEVFALPPLSDADKAAVKEDEAMAPVDTGARIDLSLLRVSAGAAAAPAAGGATGDGVVAAAQASAPAAAQAAEAPRESAPAAGSGAVWGDPQPDPERKKPTLYGADEGKTE